MLKLLLPPERKVWWEAIGKVYPLVNLAKFCFPLCHAECNVRNQGDAVNFRGCHSLSPSMGPPWLHRLTRCNI